MESIEVDTFEKEKKIMIIQIFSEVEENKSFLYDIKKKTVTFTKKTGVVNSIHFNAIDKDGNRWQFDDSDEVIVL